MSEESSNIPAVSGDGSEEMKKCPFCAEMIKADAIVCRYCGRDLVVDESKKSKESGPQILGLIGVVCGVIGLFIFGLVLGPVAILCGAISLGMGNKGGKPALILGIMDIISAILALILFPGVF